MEDSIEALHELMHFFYFKHAPIYGIVRDVIENTFLPWQCSKSTKVWNSERNTAAQALNRVVHLINMLLKDKFRF